MRITNLPPSPQVSTPASAASPSVRASFSTRLQDSLAGAAPTAQASGAPSGRNVLSAAMASQATPNGAVADAYGLAKLGKGTGLENAAAKMAQTPEQFAAIKEVVSQSLMSSANSIFGMGGSKLALDKE
jgi:hypothetical protein